VNSDRFANHSQGRSSLAKRFKADGCTQEELCVRCAMVKVMAHRFSIFRDTFGREPLPAEPLFFVPGAAHPVPAQQQEFNAQLAEAAEKTGVSVVKIWDFLGAGEPIRIAVPRLRAVK
jgi:hypothetical protein